MKGGSITRREVKTQIVAEGCPEPSDDQIDRWADAFACGQPSQGGLSAYGYTEAQAQRLVLIAKIVKGLPSKRVRKSEIAFWLAFQGAVDVPPDLVCEHIEASVRTFQRRSRRILNELGRRNEADCVGVKEIAKKLAGLLARNIVLKLVPALGRSMLAREFLSILIGIFLRASTRTTPYAEVSGEIGRATAVLSPTSEPLPGDARQELFSILADASQLLRLDDKNEMLIGIRAVTASGDSAQVFLIVESARKLLITASQVFPWMLNPSVLTSFALEDRRFLARYFAPIVCGVRAAIRDNEYAKQLDVDLREGNTERTLTEFSQAKQLGDHVANRLSTGVSHE
jgi:hypothetical protein